MAESPDSVPRVKWRTVGVVAAIVTIVGVIGLILTVAPIALANNPTPGKSISVTGVPAFAMLLGILLTLAAVVCFIPAVAITALITRTAAAKTPTTIHNPAAPVRLPRTPPPSPSTPGGGGTAPGRRARASNGGNMVGLGTRRSRRAAWIVTGLLAGPFTAIFLISFVPGAVIVAGLATPLLAAALIIVIAVLALKSFAFNHNHDQHMYSNHFHTQPPDVQAWGARTIEERRWTEQVQPIPHAITVFHRLNHVLTQAASELNTHQLLPGRRVPADPWAEAMWRRFGPCLLGREITLRQIAAQTSSPFTPYIPTDTDIPAPAPTVLIDGGRSAMNYQQRNTFVIPDPVYPVHIIDLTMLNHAQLQPKGQPVEYIPKLQTFTYLETWFPADHWLHAYPRTRTSLNRWGGLGALIDASARQFNRRFSVQTDNPAWARLVLNPAVMKMLIDLAPVRFTIDAGRLILHTHNGWLPPADIPGWVQTVQDLARSAQAAETR